jgi:hypothetical protein
VRYVDPLVQPTKTVQECPKMFPEAAASVHVRLNVALRVRNVTVMGDGCVSRCIAY